MNIFSIIFSVILLIILSIKTMNFHKKINCDSLFLRKSFENVTYFLSKQDLKNKKYCDQKIEIFLFRKKILFKSKGRSFQMRISPLL